MWLWMWLLVHAQISGKPCQWKGPRVACEPVNTPNLRRGKFKQEYSVYTYSSHGIIEEWYRLVNTLHKIRLGNSVIHGCWYLTSNDVLWLLVLFPRSKFNIAGPWTCSIQYSNKTFYSSFCARGPIQMHFFLSDTTPLSFYFHICFAGYFNRLIRNMNWSTS